MKEFIGIPASPGVAVGRAFVVARKQLAVERREIEPQEIEAEKERLLRALAATKEEFAALRDAVSSSDNSIRAEILDAYMLILDDELLVERSLNLIEKEKVAAEYAFNSTLDRMLDVFREMDDPYFRERAVDLRDVGNRVVMNLLGVAHRYYDEMGEGAVVVAHDLPPSEAAALPRGRIAAIVTEVGSRTSHTAIIAQSLEIPAVVGAAGVTGYLRGGDKVAVDGSAGRVTVNPTADLENEYVAAGRAYAAEKERWTLLAELPAVTRDGFRVELSANIELPEELEAVRRHGCDGIGLYRTEFLFLHRNDLPSEEEQTAVYRRVAEAAAPHTAIIRTIDIGGDKFLSIPEVARELNPYLGLRAIRFCLKRRDIFYTQLRAILRASAYGKVKIMFPMISDIKELREAREVVEDVREGLRKEAIPFDETCEVGIMVEVPSAALNADALARECDFFSLGTNDLIQYTLAADRGNEKIAYLYEPFHPAVIRLIRQTVEAAHRNNIWVGVCGEMAADPKAAYFLLGLACDELSVSPASVPLIKSIIRGAEFGAARTVAERVSKMTDADDIRRYLAGEIKLMGGA